MTSAAALDRRPAGRALPDQVWLPALLAGLLALAFVGALLVRAGGDASLLVHAAPPNTSATAAPGSLTVQAADEGFDGQFFYRLGVSPWSKDREVGGVTYDLPSLRNARWGYGALAFVASGGDPDLVPWALVGLNLVAAVAVGAVGGGLARASGRHAAWGLALVLWPGFAYSLSLDTSELVASAFALGGLLALRHRRWLPAGLLLTAAVLTRDTTAAIPAGIVLAGAVTWWTARQPSGALVAALGTGPDTADRREGSAPGAAVGARTPASAPDAAVAPGDGPRLAAAGLVALVAFGAWQLLQRARFGALPLTSSGDNNLSGPLVGLVDLARDSLPPSGGDEAFRVLSAAGLVLLVGLAAWCWRRSATPLAERCAWLPAVVVVLLLNGYLWSGATAFMRAGTEAGLLSILVVLGSAKRWPLPLATLGLGGLWLLTAAAQLSKLG
ncbi:hypothetical protein KSP35_19185 [Aquihabitans sp. G128]|uniref:hypothetical protein n=1 Tax=Aquihabitans sp. G128 TaxID=2849779 RepID=UPI001C219AED|nr:hypothetical protein [Aquihabitans sp. G128]QXC60429.1 hypothetical protein KSP35_19185 [Aquihabitans sp. G128]